MFGSIDDLTNNIGSDEYGISIGSLLEFKVSGSSLTVSLLIFKGVFN
jgi:hypothetical protein